VTQYAPPTGIAWWRVSYLGVLDEFNRPKFIGYFYGKTAFQVGNKAVSHIRREKMFYVEGSPVIAHWSAFDTKMVWDTGMKEEEFNAKREAAGSVIEPLGAEAFGELQKTGEPTGGLIKRKKAARKRKSVAQQGGRKGKK